eukprot:TRINITY_DN5036_c0_g2_i1.p1 TRINITY_DN5036_c0_g2~~TRINITY_DN5036_c0_g2_i1.p1  ORF type:complete len:1144 (+),score=270.12 TRINITY_DN5036_c0_g2_i1:54-3485(+)
MGDEVGRCSLCRVRLEEDDDTVVHTEDDGMFCGVCWKYMVEAAESHEKTLQTEDSAYDKTSNMSSANSFLESPSPYSQKRASATADTFSPISEIPSARKSPPLPSISPLTEQIAVIEDDEYSQRELILSEQIDAIQSYTFFHGRLRQLALETYSDSGSESTSSSDEQKLPSGLQGRSPGDFVAKNVENQMQKRIDSENRTGTPGRNTSTLSRSPVSEIIVIKEDDTDDESTDDGDFLSVDESDPTPPQASKQLHFDVTSSSVGSSHPTKPTAAIFSLHPQARSSSSNLHPFQKESSPQESQGNDPHMSSTLGDELDNIEPSLGQSPGHLDLSANGVWVEKDTRSHSQSVGNSSPIDARTMSQGLSILEQQQAAYDLELQKIREQDEEYLRLQLSSEERERERLLQQKAAILKYGSAGVPAFEESSSQQSQYSSTQYESESPGGGNNQSSLSPPLRRSLQQGVPTTSDPSPRGARTPGYQNDRSVSASRESLSHRSRSAREHSTGQQHSAVDQSRDTSQTRHSHSRTTYDSPNSSRHHSPAPSTSNPTQHHHHHPQTSTSNLVDVAADDPISVTERQILQQQNQVLELSQELESNSNQNEFDRQLSEEAKRTQEIQKEIELKREARKQRKAIATERAKQRKLLQILQQEQEEEEQELELLAVSEIETTAIITEPDQPSLEVEIQSKDEVLLDPSVSKDEIILTSEPRSRSNAQDGDPSNEKVSSGTQPSEKDPQVSQFENRLSTLRETSRLANEEISIQREMLDAQRKHCSELEQRISSVNYDVKRKEEISADLGMQLRAEIERGESLARDLMKQQNDSYAESYETQQTPPRSGPDPDAGSPIEMSSTPEARVRPSNAPDTIPPHSPEVKRLKAVSIATYRRKLAVIYKQRHEEAERFTLMHAEATAIIGILEHFDTQLWKCETENQNPSPRKMSPTPTPMTPVPVTPASDDEEDVSILEAEPPEDGLIKLTSGQSVKPAAHLSVGSIVWPALGCVVSSDLRVSNISPEGAGAALGLRHSDRLVCLKPDFDSPIHLRNPQTLHSWSVKDISTFPECLTICVIREMSLPRSQMLQVVKPPLSAVHLPSSAGSRRVVLKVSIRQSEGNNPTNRSINRSQSLSPAVEKNKNNNNKKKTLSKIKVVEN